LWRLFVYWVVFCVISVIIYIFLQMLHSVNFWESIGVSPAPDHIEPFSSLGMLLFEIIIVFGWSIITCVFFWKIISRLFSSTQPLVRFFQEVIISWICFSGFECSIILYDEIFSVLAKGYFYPVPINVPIIINVSWVNIILVSLFYTVVGFQALRKNLTLKNFLRRVIFDIIQVLVMSFEGLLAFMPFFSTRDLALLIIPSIASYYTVFVLCLIVSLEYVWWAVVATERVRERSKQDFNNQIFLLQSSLFFIPLVIVITFFPFPFYLLVMDIGLWVVLLTICAIISVVGLFLYRLFKTMTPNVFENIEQRYKNLKYHFDLAFALRGTMFNYPPPVDILSRKELTKTIESKWQKVTLKIACGHCYHVFTIRTFKNGSKVKPVPCPFCGSMATTPVWE